MRHEHVYSSPHDINWSEVDSAYYDPDWGVWVGTCYCLAGPVEGE